MPCFYSKTEKDALRYILKHLPKPTEESKCHLGAQIDGLIRHLDQEILPTRNRGVSSDVQPLFRYPLASNSAAHQQTPQSTFSISHDTIFDHHKEIQKRQLLKWSPEASSSFLDDHGNRAWRQRPVSELSSPDRDSDLEDEHDPSNVASGNNDEVKGTVENTYGPSPRRVKSFDELPPSRLSAQSNPKTRNASLCEDDDLDYDVDDNPEIALERMDTAFSKWSHARREGIDAVSEVVIGAPTQLHAIIAQRDKKIWSNRSHLKNEVTDLENHQSQEQSQLPGSSSAASHDDGASTGQASTSKQAPEQQKEKTPLNRADLIAREKAANNASILSAPSASQRRSIRYKNKNRKSIMPTPTPSTMKQPDQQQPPPNSEAESSNTDEKKKCTVLLLNNDNDYRQTLNLALRNGSLDPKDDSHIESLYQVMSTFGNNLRGVQEQGDERGESHGKAVEDEGNEKSGEKEASNSRRKKGKARKEAKKSLAM